MVKRNMTRTSKKQVHSKSKVQTKTRTKNTSKTRKIYRHKDHYHTSLSDTDYKKAKCAPNPGKTQAFSCYTEEALHKMRYIWNMRHPDCKIESTNAREIWNQLRDYIGETCSIESCWLKQKFIKNHLDEELLSYTFAPKRPDEWKRNPTEWLSSLDILAVMKQYERRYKCFNFIGPSPIDYDTHIYDGECVWEELCEFSLKDHIKNGKNKVGIIFNLDPHYLNGSHWVAVFINIKKKIIYYFDSYGEKSEAQIKKFMETVKKQGKSLGIDFTIKENSIRHQYSDSECGMYSLYFIIEMLKDKDPEYFLKNKIHDKEVMRLRKEYFN